MKSFTLTPSTPTRRIYIYKQYCSIKIEGSDFANTQLIVEQRDNEGLWTRCSIPTINTDQEWFTITSATRRQRMRFSVVGSGAYSVPVQVKQSTDAEYNFLTTVNDPNAVGDHSHSNFAVLDATTEAFTSTELNNINDNTANNHTHANKTILDATTANFTSAAAFKLDDIEAEATKGGTKQDDTTNAIIPRVDTKSGSVAGNARGNEALDTQLVRNAATQVASGARSMILSGTNNTASAAQSAVIAATDSSSTGSGSVIIGGTSNAASGSNDEILGSQSSATSGIGSTVVGGSGCTNSGNWAIVAGGLNHTITQPRGAVLGGSGNTVNHVNSTVIGCTNLTTDAGDTVYVPSLNVGAGFKMPTGATDGYVLKTDATGVGTWQAESGGGGGGSSIVKSFIDNALVVNKPTSSSVVVSVTGLQYTMESGKTYYVKMFFNHKGGQMSGGSTNEYITLDHTPWSVTAGVEEGFMGMNYVEQSGGRAGGYHGWQSDVNAIHTYDADASTGLANFLGFQPYVGLVGIEGFITAPSTAAFTPTLTYTGAGTGSITGSFQGMIMEMP